MKAPPLSPARYSAIIATLAARGHLRVPPPPVSLPFADLDPWLAAYDFGAFAPPFFDPPDDYYALPPALLRAA